MKTRIVKLLLIAMAAMPSTASAGPTWRSNDFLSPSGNISCHATFSWMQCVTFNNGHVAMLARDGRVLTSRGSYGFRRQAPRLAYNTYWQGFAFECDSAVSGVTCQNLRTGSGFTIAREGISWFGV